MSRLSEKYPHAQKVSASDRSNDDPEGPVQVVTPYLGWQLLELDIQTTDLLLLEPAQDGASQPLRRSVILSGQLASAWLRHAQHTQLQDDTA